MKALASGAVVLAFAASVLAQSVPYGDPNFDRAADWRSGQPIKLTVSANDVVYEFDGSPVDIPFTLSGTGGEVHLAVYSKDANPQYGGAATGEGGVGNAMLRAAGLDTFIAYTGGQTFSQGNNTITWDGRDFHGNAVAPGSYHFYVFALDNASNPTWVGKSGVPGYWTTFRIDPSSNPPSVWFPQGVGGDLAILRDEIGTDYFQNPEAFETFEVPWMNERRGVAPDPQWDVSFYELDPTNSNVGYIGNKGMFDAARPSGIWRTIYDPANGTILPDESWAGSDRGFLQLENRVTDGAMKKAAHHPWATDDGLIWVGITDREDPKVPRIVGYDRDTGELANTLDLTDIYFVENSDGSTTTMGPWGIEVDDRGIYGTGYWIEPNSFSGHFSESGDLIWYNRNGDGFLDRYFGEEAEAIGHDPNADQNVVVHIKSGRWNIAFASGFNLPIWGTVLGPDGHGLFNVTLPKMPVSLGSDMVWMDNDTAIDGLYVPGENGQSLVHYPFDVARSVITNDISTAVAALGGAAPDDYSLDGNYPNPFNPETTIQFSIPDDAGVATLKVYNSAGQIVAELVNEQLTGGNYAVTWDGRDLRGEPVSSGVYIYRLQAGDYVASDEMTLLK